jgi:hypothetical protein
VGTEIESVTGGEETTGHTMTTLLEFLENARFPNPPVQTTARANTTDVSLTDLGLIHEAWKARRAIKDPDLTDHLCQTLQEILGQTPLPENADFLRRRFSPELDGLGLWVDARLVCHLVFRRRPEIAS